jgi:hypothetical protein
MEDNRMRATYKRVLIATLTMTLSVGFALAKPKANKTVNVTLVAVTTMPDGAQLEPGDYRIAVFDDPAAPQVEVYRHGKLVCKCPVKIENAPAKAETTQLIFDVPKSGAHILKTVAIGGSTQRLIFSASSAPGAAL